MVNLLISKKNNDSYRGFELREKFKILNALKTFSARFFNIYVEH